jgi:hypothetical protein
MAPRLTQSPPTLPPPSPTGWPGPRPTHNLIVVVAAYGVAYLLAARLRRLVPALAAPPLGA